LQTESIAAPTETVPARSGAGRKRVRLSGVVASLTGANVIGAATGFITGPLLARALGASGRGDLAAIIVPLSLAAPVLGLGISGFAYRELPSGRPFEEVFGSLGLPLLLIGLLTAAAAIPIADALAGGRETVRTFLIVGLLATPLVLIGGLLAASLAATERWRAVFATNLIPFFVPFVAIVALYVSGRLTVATAAAVTIGGSLVAVVPALPLLTTARRPVFRRSIARNGVSFGLKGWLGGLALLANLRLDQLLMITLVAPRVLGLYAVAATISGASGLATGGLAPPLMTRVAAGEIHLLPQAVRIVVTATVGLNLLLALLTPAILSLLFGPAFHGAIAMALVLLAASVPYAGASVLSAGLQADGAPLIPTVAEGIALVITVAGLVTLLRPLGGIGAAIVSLAAYSASFLFQLVMARRRTAVPVSVFLVPTRADVRWARDLLRPVTVRLRSAR
jgi:O-antigen/teichoic acid export membrane protein